MAANIKKETSKQLNLLAKASANTRADLMALHTPELVIALCGPIGSPLHDVSDNITDLLTTKFGYNKCETIRLSQFIAKYAELGSNAIPDSEADRLQEYIRLGNEMREKYGTEILAKLAIKKIAESRAADGMDSLVQQKTESEGPLAIATRPIRVAHVIDSIKNQSELDILKLVYGDLLYTIGVYAPLNLRETNLKRKGMRDDQVYQLIDRDSGEELANGQTVRQTFPFSDYFLRVENRTESEISERVERFLSLILGIKPITPTVHEMAMHAAASAAGHSACLSRQVGACITSASGDILSTGWNDVPKFGGAYT